MTGINWVKSETFSRGGNVQHSYKVERGKVFFLHTVVGTFSVLPVVLAEVYTIVVLEAFGWAHRSLRSSGMWIM